MKKLAFHILYNSFCNIRLGKYGSSIRCYFLKAMGCSIGKSCYIGSNVTIVDANKLIMGDSVSVHQNCYIDASGGVEIGNNVSIAHGVSIVSFNHTYKDKNCPIKNQPIEYSPILIGNNVWIGCKATILAGTTIKDRTIVAANALCNKKYGDGIIIGGVPAKLIKSI